MEEMDLLEEYRGKFPNYWPPISACVGVPVHFDPEVCEWLWRKSSPLDKVARRFSEGQARYSICPHRFSIGAILFRRGIWDQVGGFEVGPDYALGVEERQLCNFCMDQSKVIVVAENVLCGHFGFRPQNDRMHQLLLSTPEVFECGAGRA